MCGIAGFINYKKNQDKNLLEKGLDCITHRGPDDDGVYIRPEFTMGMRRLSIIDIAHGKQPIANEDETVQVVFNGELYNHLELRAELIDKGHIFKTQSDTEVLVHGYEEWGKELPARLRGMFAFAIHDVTNNILFIARDHFGIKPLYYRMHEGQIVSFASEIKSILADTTYKKEVDMDAVHAYATLQYSPKTSTFFKTIHKLNPGHSLTIDLHTEVYLFEKYWQFSFDDARQRDENYEGKKEQIKDVLTDSVAHHMIADVPVASFLSSGVDSSIIASLAHAHMQSINPEAKLKTYTIGFQENRSETEDAAEHAKYLGTDHKEIQISFDDYFKVLKKCAWHFDEPVADPSAISLYLMAREVAKEVKVVLSGEGADELFGGYGIYQETHNPWIKLITRQPRWFKSGVLKPISVCLNAVTDMLPVLKKMPGVSYLHRAVTPVRFRYLGNASIFTEKEKKKLFKNYKSSNMVAKLELADQDISKMSESEYMQYVDIHNWMRGDILAKADKMTMAHSLELRVPFLDVEVSNVARTINDSWKYIGGTTKYILRDAFKYVMPAKTNKRPKLGFPTPWHTWLQRDASEVKKTILDSKFIQEICNVSEIEKMFTPGKLKDKFIGRRIFVLLMLALWYNVYIEESYA